MTPSLTTLAEVQSRRFKYRSDFHGEPNQNARLISAPILSRRRLAAPSTDSFWKIGDNIGFRQTIEEFRLSDQNGLAQC